MLTFSFREGCKSLYLAMGVCILGFFFLNRNIKNANTSLSNKTTFKDNPSNERLHKNNELGNQDNQQSVTKSLLYFSSTLKHRRAIRKEIFSSFYIFNGKEAVC